MSSPDAEEGEEYRRKFAELFSQQRATLNDISTLEQARKEYELLNTQLEELRKSLPLAVQSDDALASWPREKTRARVEALEVDLRRAFAEPGGLFQKLWRSLRPSQVEARRKAAREPLPHLAGRRSARRRLERFLHDMANLGRSRACGGSRAKLRAKHSAIAASRRLQSPDGKRPTGH